MTHDVDDFSTQDNKAQRLEKKQNVVHTLFRSAYDWSLIGVRGGIFFTALVISESVSLLSAIYFSAKEIIQIS